MANRSTNTVTSGEKAGHLKESNEGFLYEVVDKIKDDEDYSKLSMVTMNTDSVYATATTTTTVMKSGDTMSPQDSSVPKEMPPTAPKKASGKQFACTLVIIAAVAIFALILLAILFAENFKLKNQVSSLQQ